MSKQKLFGQNFLTNKNIASKIVTLIGEENNKKVLEIGPGKGILTEELLNKGYDVVAVEIDRELIPYLQEKFGERITIINKDVLKIDLNKILSENDIRVIISNLPYSISTAIMKKFIVEKVNFYKGIFMFQKEVAEKIAADEKSRVVGVLSVLLQYSFNIKKEFTVKAGSFSPKPKVDSEVLSFTAKKVPVSYYDKEFVNFVYMLFQNRRKKIKSRFRKSEISDKEISGILEKRVEEVSFEEIELLFDYFK